MYRHKVLLEDERDAKLKGSRSEATEPQALCHGHSSGKAGCYVLGIFLGGKLGDSAS